MLSVTVTVSLLMTGDPSTSIDTVSTGGLAALGVQLKEKEVPVVRKVGVRGVGSSGGSAEQHSAAHIYNVTVGQSFRTNTCIHTQNAVAGNALCGAKAE